MAAGEAGPVIVLSGEADMISTPQLTALLGDQLNRRALHLTIDASSLNRVDSMSGQVLVTVAKTLRARGGSLVLLHPQIPVTRMLTLMGADQVITIRGAAEAEPESGAELAPADGVPRRFPSPVSLTRSRIRPGVRWYAFTREVSRPHAVEIPGRRPGRHR